jgi:hypothetical protein
MTARRSFIGAATAVASVLVVAGMLAIGGGHDVAGARSVRATPTRVARGFLDAYGGFESNRALKVLSNEAIVDGQGWPAGGWGSREAFRSELSLLAAIGFKQIVTGCEEQPAAPPSATVHCDFDVHAIRSNEIGFGPYTGNSWDFVVRDGKIASVASNWGYLTNGFSQEIWEPFRAWVTSAHPDDVEVMYRPGGAVMTDESIRLWEKRSREWVKVVKASAR